MKTNAREIALKVIHEVHAKGAYANVSLARELAKHDLEERDRRFATELVYGTVKAGATLDWILGRFVSRPLDKVAPIILDILRLGVYQLQFLTKIPPSAACNQSVELAKKYGHRGTANFVNGVLRNIVRQSEKLAYPADESAEAIALRYCHPRWLVERWLAQFGREATMRLCAFNNSTPPLTIRTNTLKTSRDALEKTLAAEGVTFARSSLAPEGLLCTEYPSLHRLRSLKEGLFQVQDESSMLAAHILAPAPGEFIIDACSAPGGKATHIAALMKNRGRILANDIYAHKLALVEENAARLGVSILETALGDAASLGEKYPRAADRVLVDAPCSGLGVLRRKPDLRWNKELRQLAAISALQLDILHDICGAVRPGGVLVYSTCSIDPEENDAVIEKFLALHEEFYLEDAAEFLPLTKKAGKTLHFYPQADGTDGFFIARMKRKE